MPKFPKFVQIATTGDGDHNVLFALDESGSVWVYATEGEKNGWAPVPDHRFPAAANPEHN